MFSDRTGRRTASDVDMAKLSRYGGNMLQTAGCIVSRWGGRPNFIDLSAGYGVDPQGKLSGCIHLMDVLLASYPLDVYLCEANSERAVVLRQTVLARYGPHLRSGRLRAWVQTRAYGAPCLPGDGDRALRARWTVDLERETA